jgi:Zn-dependent peptidase ImmA (M78 family)
MAAPRSFKLRVGSIDYTVAYVKDLRDPDSGVPLFGLLMLSTGTISIEANMASQAQQQTLWHEILHAFLFQAGIRSEMHNEVQIDVLAYGVMGLLNSPGSRHVLPPGH